MEKIAIEPVELGLGMGVAHFVAIHVNYTMGSTDLTLDAVYYDSIGKQLNASPQPLIVTPEVMQSWGLDFDPVRSWVLEQIGADPK